MINVDPVSLYIHIPFCKKKCNYCDFFSIPCGDSGVPEIYLTALKNEISFYKEKFFIPSWKTIYIGGGTPSLLTPEQLQDLVSFVLSMNKGKNNCEVTVEFNPDDITKNLLTAAANSGVTRLSIGIQVLDDKALDFVHRRCTKKSSLKALSLIQKYWHSHFSLDLIAGLPFVDDVIFRNSLKMAMSYNPDHISLYSLTIENKTKLGKLIESGKYFFDIDKADKQWLTGKEILEQNGYYQYEISNFSKKDCVSLHNLTYWNMESYIGCGAGATGSIYGLIDENEKKIGFRWTNNQNINKYEEFWNSYLNMMTESYESSFSKIPCEKEFLDKKTITYEFFMMGLRKIEGICLDSLKMKKNFIDDNLVDSFLSHFYEWKEQGFAENYYKEENKYYRLSKKGILFLNKFLIDILI